MCYANAREITVLMICRSQAPSEAFPVAKVAELKKLKTCANQQPVLGAEISSSSVSISIMEYHMTYGHYGKWTQLNLGYNVKVQNHFTKECPTFKPLIVMF